MSKIDFENTYIKYILNEMCYRVKGNINKVPFNYEDWQYTYSWTEKEAEDFGIWLTVYFKTHSGARVALFGKEFRYKDGYKTCQSLAGIFILSYGWIIK